jgi:hypothetical protein
MKCSDWLAGVAFLVMAGGPVTAQCVTAADLAGGILFDRQGAGTGSAIAVDEDTVQVDYDAGRRGYTDRRTMALGVYETEILSVSAPPDVIGVWSDRLENRSFVGRFPRPEAGRTWETRINMTWEMSDFSGIPQGGRERMEVAYVFLPPNDVTLSGCAYQVIPLEMRLRWDDNDYTHRYAYFPAIGVAIETQVTNHNAGWQNTHGITGLRLAQ